MTAQTLLFLAFFAAFAVKVPMWPVHTWLPDAHVEAPTGGSIILAAIMLKLGAYGFLRFSLPIAPDASHELAGFVIALSLIAVVYIGFVALVQSDMKKLVAYSSIAHMGFVTLGFFIFNPMGMTGGIVQMISHGFVSGAMFFCIGVMYDRMHSRDIADYGGVVNTMPKFAAFFMLFVMANAGLPATSGFVGEFMVILGAVQYNFWIALVAGTTLVLGAAYSLWMYKRVIFGEVANKHVADLVDVNRREFAILTLLAASVLWMGLYPKPVTDLMDASVAQLLKHVAVSKLPTRRPERFSDELSWPHRRASRDRAACRRQCRAGGGSLRFRRAAQHHLRYDDCWRWQRPQSPSACRWHETKWSSASAACTSPTRWVMC